MTVSLEPTAGERDAWVVVVRDQVAAAKLRGIEPARGRGPVDHALTDRGQHRVADASELRRQVLVLEHDATAGLIVFDRVGRPAQVDQHVELVDARAWIRRIGADIHGVLELEPDDPPEFVEPDARPDEMGPRMDIGDERFEPIGDELDRPGENARQRRGRHFVAIEVDLDAVGAADVRTDHPHPMLRNPEMLGQQGLHDVRRLTAMVDGERPVRRCEVGEDRARLGGYAGLAIEPERGLDRRPGASEPRFRITGLEPPFEGEVVAELVMDDGCPRVERRRWVDDRGKGLPLDADALDRVLGGGPGIGHRHRDRLSLPAHPVDGERVLGRRPQTGNMGEDTPPGRGRSR